MRLLARPFRAPLVGVDLGSGSLKIVALRRARGGWALVGAAAGPTPPDSVRDGVVADSAALAEALRALFTSLRLRRVRVAAALAGNAVIVKRLSLPTMTDAELRDAIPWEAEQYIPFDLSEVQIDYHVLSRTGPPAPGAAPNTLDVLLVAAKRDSIDDRASLIRLAGREPAVLDVEAFALANAYEASYPDRSDALVALVHVGRRTTVVCLLEHGRPAFTRDISLGGAGYVEALVRELHVEAAAAERLAREAADAGTTAEPVAAALRETTTQLVAEVKKSVEFYRATAPVERLNRLVLSGGASRALGLAEALAGEFDAPVDTFAPGRRLVRRDDQPELGPEYTVAVGLALREDGSS